MQENQDNLKNNEDNIYQESFNDEDKTEKITKKLSEKINKREEYQNEIKKIIKQCTDKNKIDKNKIRITEKMIGLLSGNKSHPFDNIYFMNKKGKPMIIPKNKVSMSVPFIHREKILLIYKMTSNL